MLPGIAEALDGYPHRIAELEVRCQMSHKVVAAPRGRVAAPQRSTERDRFSGDHGGLVLADDLRVLVRHPAHDHGVGVVIWRRNVPVGPDDARERLYVCARQPLQFRLGQRARVHLDGALYESDRISLDAGLKSAGQLLLDVVRSFQAFFIASRRRRRLTDCEVRG